MGWTLRVPVLLSKQLVQVWDFWAVWSCAYLFHVFFRKILMVLFVTETRKCHHPVPVRVNGVEKQRVLPVGRGAALSAEFQPWWCRSGLILHVLPRCFAHTSGLAVLGKGRCPEYTNVVLPAQTRAQVLPERLRSFAHPLQSVINCRVKGVWWLLSANNQFLLQLLGGS